MVHMACLTHQWYVLVLTTLVLNAPDAGGTFFQAHLYASAASALGFLLFWSFLFNCAVKSAFLFFRLSNSADKAIIFFYSLVGMLYSPSLMAKGYLKHKILVKEGKYNVPTKQEQKIIALWAEFEELKSKNDDFTAQ